MIMRFLKGITVAAIFAVVLSSCAGESPESVVLKFHDAIDRIDLESARKYVTKESEATIDVLKRIAEREGLQIGEGDSDIKTVIVSSQINDEEDTAIVVFQMVDGSGNVVDESDIFLVKENKEWKIALGR